MRRFARKTLLLLLWVLLLLLLLAIAEGEEDATGLDVTPTCFLPSPVIGYRQLDLLGHGPMHLHSFLPSLPRSPG